MKNIAILILLLLLLFANSCSIYKPDSHSVTTPDYNKRVEVSGAHYDRVLTPVGYSTIIAGTAAGAYAGYIYGKDADMFAGYDGTEKKHINAGSAVLGALTGFTTTMLLNKLFGWGNVFYSSDPEIWMEKVNTDYLLLKKGESKFTMIHPSVEPVFTVKGMKDAEDFKTIFPNSTYTDRVISQCVINFKRNELPLLLNLYTSIDKNNKIKNRYLHLSSSVPECIEAKDKYSELTNSADSMSVSLIKGIEDFKLFKRNFPQSNNMELALNNTMKKISISALPELIDLFTYDQRKNIDALIKAQNKYISNSTDFKTYYKAITKYPKIENNEEKKLAGYVKNEDDYSLFINKYSKKSKHINDAFINAFDNIEWTKIPEIMKQSDFVSQDLKSKAQQKYSDQFYKEYNRCNSADDYLNFINKFNYLHEDFGLIEKATYNYDLQSASSINDWADFARKYLNKYSYADQQAYNITSSTNSSSCYSYLNLFKNGSYTSSVKSRLTNALAYEERKRIEEERRRREEERRRREENRRRYAECASGCKVKSWNYESYNESYEEDHYELILENYEEFDVVYDRPSSGWEIEKLGFNDTGYDSQHEAVQKIIEDCLYDCDYKYKDR